MAATAWSSDSFVVKYLSMEHVYLDGGESDGLTVGTRLNVLGPNGVKAELEVVYVAAHSASCKVIGRIDLVQVGDKVALQSPLVRDTVVVADSTPVATPDPIQTSPQPKVTRPRREPSPVTGNISLVFYHYNDDTEPNLDFTQATTRMSLKARRLFGQELTLTVRGRGRFDKRVRSFSSGLDDQDWTN